ncbi:putative disease resistance protein RGA3 [Carex rostrata]
MAGKLITSLLSRTTNLLPTIRASGQAPSASSSNSNDSEREHAHAVENDLEKLMRTLKRIKATLYDAEEREIRDHSVKLWLKELKMVSYDAEDLLSEYRYEVTRVQVEARKASQASGSQMEYIVPMPAGMVDRLKKIRIQFEEIAKDREALQLRENDGVKHPNNKISRTPTGHMVDEASIFGRGAEITEVINFLLSEKEKSFSVISIVDKGGLGKTTIAQLVYKDRRVSQCFDLLGWVCVSEEFDVRRLIKATIESVSSKIDYGLSELSPLQKELAKTVKEKTILLVLDDVWNENQSLWELFQVPLKEAKMWYKIMRKCGGLPLAVKSIASLLRHETDEEGWRKILESDLWESNPSNDIFPALQISYAHLLVYLKPCLLFCSTYPKDYILEKKNLIELWISHGYIESRGKRKITEIGVEYYEELKERSFLDDFLDQSSECCKLHDIIHDLARLNSENEHYSVEINQPIDIQEGSVPQETYHLFARGFAGYINQFLQQNLKGLRTLSMDMRGCTTCGGELEHQYCIDNTKAYITSLPNLSKYYEECWGDIGTCNLTKFEALRVLELNGYSLTKIPHTICQLKHLAYLGIISFRLKVLPLSIGLLYNLQTLILDCPFLEYLPESIGDLANLMRLVIKSDELKEVPLELINLCNLHGLTIRCNWIQALPNTIGCLSSLEELNLLPNIVNHKHDYVPHGLVNFPTIKTMKAWLRVRTIAWLKDMKDLEGKLYVEGLGNMNNLVDIQKL